MAYNYVNPTITSEEGKVNHRKKRRRGITGSQVPLGEGERERAVPLVELIIIKKNIISNVSS